MCVRMRIYTVVCAVARKRKRTAGEADTGESCGNSKIREKRLLVSEWNQERDENLEMCAPYIRNTLHTRITTHTNVCVCTGVFVVNV